MIVVSGDVDVSIVVDKLTCKHGAWIRYPGIKMRGNSPILT